MHRVPLGVGTKEPSHTEREKGFREPIDADWLIPKLRLNCDSNSFGYLQADWLAQQASSRGQLPCHHNLWLVSCSHESRMHPATRVSLREITNSFCNLR